MAVNNTYAIPQTQFIGGTTIDFTFNVKDSNGTAIDLTGATIEWNLRQYGGFYTSAILEKSSTLITEIEVTDAVNGVFKVYLESADTQDLFGKFIQQPIITDVAGKKFIPAQGVIVIDKSTTAS